MEQRRDATRRNRNIGTAKQGHGQDNELVIPESRHTLKIFWADLTSYHVVERRVKGKFITILVERTRVDCVHACTVDDLVFLLSHLPEADLAHFNLIILRQPKRKEAILSSCWGRAVFWVSVDKYEGPAIILEAQSLAKPLRWAKSLSPDRQHELERLKQDGHKVEADKRYHIITPTLEAIRATQLYRTLLHEIGHHIDYERTECEQWDQKTSLEKETFAHQHADKRRRELAEKGVIPFPRILSLGSLRSEGLALEDFQPLDEKQNVR